MIYTIKKGNHYPTPKQFSLHTGISSETKTVRFDPNCYFHTGTQDDNDWNKTWGYTQDILGRNSLRIGWRPLKNNITLVQLGVYIHIGGVRYSPANWDLGSYEWNSWIKTTIAQDGHFATFTAGEIIQVIPYEICVCMGYRQYPYFGGQLTAPQTMTIEIL